MDLQFIPNLPKKYYHEIGEDQLSAQQKVGLLGVS